MEKCSEFSAKKSQAKEYSRLHRFCYNILPDLLNFEEAVVNFTFLHRACGGPLGVFLINNKADMQRTQREVGKIKCKCGAYATDLVVVVIKEDAEEAARSQGTWDKPPSVRHPKSYLKSLRERHVPVTDDEISKLGGQATEFIELCVREVLDLCPPDLQSNLSLIPVRSLRTYEPNAVCIKFQRSSVPAIVLHDGLVAFLHHMNRSVMPFFDIGTLGNIYDHNSALLLQSNVNQEKLQLQAVKTALYFLGLSSRQKSIELKTDYESICEVLTRQMIEFLLAHEYAHAVLNHHASSSRNKWRGNDYFYRCSRKMESAADEWAQDVICGAHTTPRDSLQQPLTFRDGLQQLLNFSAPILAFLYFDFLGVIRAQVMSRGKNIDPSGSADSVAARSAATHQTHPSDRIRAKKLLEYVMRHGSWQHTQLISIVDNALENVLQRSASLLRELGFETRQTTSRVPDRLIGSSDDGQIYASVMAKIYSEKLSDLEAQEKIDEARKAIDEGQISLASRLIEELLETGGSDFRMLQCLFLLAHLNYERGDIDRSVELIYQAAEFNRSDDLEDQFQALAALATMVGDQLPESRSEDRIRLYKIGTMCTESMFSGIAHSKLGLILGMNGKIAEAVLELENAYKIGHEFSKGEAAGNLAAALVATKDRRSNVWAVELALEAISRSESDRSESGEFLASVRISLGMAYANLGRRSKAEEALRNASQISNPRIRSRALEELRKLWING